MRQEPLILSSSAVEEDGLYCGNTEKQGGANKGEEYSCKERLCNNKISVVEGALDIRPGTEADCGPEEEPRNPKFVYNVKANSVTRTSAPVIERHKLSLYSLKKRKVSESAPSEVDPLNPDRHIHNSFSLVHKADQKNCLASVKRCQSCKRSFTESDWVLVKTKGKREWTSSNDK
eukprot:gene3823-4354_t